MPKFKYDIQETLGEKDVRAMFDLCQSEYERVAIALLWITGARPMELIPLTSDMVKIEPAKITIILHTLKLGSKEFAVKNRTLEFERLEGTEANPYLETVVRVAAHTPPTLPLIPYGKRWLEKLTNRLGKDTMDKEISPYHFRHSFFTWAARNGWTLDQLKQFKGAKDYKSVWRYVNAIPSIVKLQLMKRDFKG